MKDHGTPTGTFLVYLKSHLQTGCRNTPKLQLHELENIETNYNTPSLRKLEKVKLLKLIFDCNRQQTNLEPLALLCGEAHIPRGSLSFYTQKETSKNRFTFMVNDAYSHSGPGSSKSQWKMYQTDRMTRIKGSLLKRLNIEPGNPYGLTDLTVQVALKKQAMCAGCCLT